AHSTSGPGSGTHGAHPARLRPVWGALLAAPAFERILWRSLGHKRFICACTRSGRGRHGTSYMPRPPFFTAHPPRLELSAINISYQTSGIGQQGSKLFL